MLVKVLAGMVLVSGMWGEIALCEGEDVAVPQPKYTRLPDGVANFKGCLIGSVVSSDAKGCVLKVSKVVPAADDRATNPSVIVGKNIQVLYIAYGPGKDGQYVPDKDLAAAVVRHSAKGEVITVKAAAERDEAISMNKLWPGADTDPERPDPPQKPAPAPDSKEF
jgi:hypothetical protein